MKQCSLCGVVEGGKNFHAIISNFRGLQLCEFCHDYWKQMEKHFGVKLGIDKLKKGFSQQEFDRRLIRGKSETD